MEFDDSVLMPQEYPIKRSDSTDQRPSTSLAPHIKKSSRNTNNSVSLTSYSNLRHFSQPKRRLENTIMSGVMHAEVKVEL